MKICGIYKIINIVNNLVYIGSSINIKNRWSEHKSRLNCHIHNNPYLSNAWNKYGCKNFKFEIVEECSKELLAEHEQYWMDYYKSYERDKGYNLDLKVDRSEISVETRRKLSEKGKGRMPWSFGLTKETDCRLAKAAIKRSASLLGKKRKPFTEKHKENIRIAKSIPGINNFLIGRHLSEETKQKISESNKGKHSKRFCSRGHDKDVVGRTKDGQCVICRRVSHNLANKRYLEKMRNVKKLEGN